MLTVALLYILEDDDDDSDGGDVIGQSILAEVVLAKRSSA